MQLWHNATGAPHLEASLTACNPSKNRRRGSFAQEISFPSPRHASVSSAAAKSTFSLLYLQPGEPGPLNFDNYGKESQAYA